MTTDHQNVNSVTISRKYGRFDSTYPSTVLNGIISRDEYRKSIANINRGHIRLWMKIISVISPACILVGLSIFIFGATIKNLTTARFLTSTGLIMICGVIILCSILLQKIPSNDQWLKQAVAKESEKYSRRTPIYCIWRLQTAYTDGSSDYVIIIYIYNNNVNNIHTNPVHSTVNIPQQHTTLSLPIQSITPTPNQPLLNVSGGREEEEGIVTPPPPYTAATTSTRPIFNYTEEVGTPPPPYSNTYEAICSRCGISRPYLTNDLCSFCVASTDPLIHHNS